MHDGVDDNQDARRIRRTGLLNRLLSATALGLFLEGCGGVGDDDEDEDEFGPVPPNTLSYARKADGSGVEVDILNSIYPSGFEAGEEVVVDNGEVTGGVVNLIGSRYADRLAGDGEANRLTGGRGDDALTGGAGADDYVFNAGDGKDRILTDNNGETNRLIFTEGGSAGHFNFFIKGSDLVVTVHSDDEPGGGAENHEEGRGEEGEGGGDTVESEVVLENLLVDSSSPGDTVLKLFALYYGSAESPTLAGSVSLGRSGVSNTLTGRDGERDVLLGQEVGDTLMGGTGNDFLYGGAGDDDLQGGGDNDEYWIVLGEQGNDTITDNEVTSSGDKNEIVFAAAENIDISSWSASKNSNNLDLDIAVSVNQKVTIKNFYASGVRDMFSIYTYDTSSDTTTDITTTLGIPD